MCQFPSENNDFKHAHSSLSKYLQEGRDQEEKSEYYGRISTETILKAI